MSFQAAAKRSLSVSRQRFSCLVGGGTAEIRGARRRKHQLEDEPLRRTWELEAMAPRKFLSAFPKRCIHAVVPPLSQQQKQHWREQNSTLPQGYSQPQRRTMMARSSVHAGSEDPSQDPEAKAMTFLVGTLGHDQDVAKGVLDALKQSGVSGGPALLAMVRSLAGRWEVDEDAGLEALVESVTVELARSKGKKTVSVWILPASAWASREGDDESVDKEDFKRAFKVEGFEDMVSKQASKQRNTNKMAR